MADLYRLLYISRAVCTLSKEDIDRIVSRSVSYNVERTIAGMLLFSGEHFAQVLEGPEVELTTLMQAIRSDRRHHAVRLILSEPVPQRRFSQWSMSYVHDEGRCDLLEQVVEADQVRIARARRLVDFLFPSARHGSVPRPAKPRLR